MRERSHISPSAVMGPRMHFLVHAREGMFPLCGWLRAALFTVKLAGLGFDADFHFGEQSHRCSTRKQSLLQC